MGFIFLSKKSVLIFWSFFGRHKNLISQNVVKKEKLTFFVLISFPRFQQIFDMELHVASGEQV